MKEAPNQNQEVKNHRLRLTTGFVRMRWKMICSEEPQKGGKPSKSMGSRGRARGKRRGKCRSRGRRAGAGSALRARPAASSGIPCLPTAARMHFGW